MISLCWSRLQECALCCDEVLRVAKPLRLRRVEYLLDLSRKEDDSANRTREIQN
jgi:hypothetical protein